MAVKAREGLRFVWDVYISYAHIDNQPLTPEQKGWISRFHALLEALLSVRLGRAAKIWRDDKLQGNDVLADEIVDQFAQTAVLVSVLTPRYLNSDWCNKEVAEFCKSAEQNGGVGVDNKARVFKVFKAPVDTQESLPALVRDVWGRSFSPLKTAHHWNWIRPTARSLPRITTARSGNWPGMSRNCSRS